MARWTAEEIKTMAAAAKLASDTDRAAVSLRIERRTLYPTLFRRPADGRQALVWVIEIAGRSTDLGEVGVVDAADAQGEVLAAVIGHMEDREAGEAMDAGEQIAAE